MISSSSQRARAPVEAAESDTTSGDGVALVQQQGRGGEDYLFSDVAVPLHEPQPGRLDDLLLELEPHLINRRFQVAEEDAPVASRNHSFCHDAITMFSGSNFNIRVINQSVKMHIYP